MRSDEDFILHSFAHSEVSNFDGEQNPTVQVPVKIMTVDIMARDIMNGKLGVDKRSREISSIK